MASTQNYAIGHNLAGYSPDPDSVYVVESWEDAVEALKDEMRTYAGADDDAAWDYLYSLSEPILIADYPCKVENGHITEVDFGDDTPSMLATVDSIIADNSVWYDAQAGNSVTECVSDNDGRVIAFWIQPTDEEIDNA